MPTTNPLDCRLTRLIEHPDGRITFSTIDEDGHHTDYRTDTNGRGLQAHTHGTWQQILTPALLDLNPTYNRRWRVYAALIEIHPEAHAEYRDYLAYTRQGDTLQAVRRFVFTRNNI